MQKKEQTGVSNQVSLYVGSIQHCGPSTSQLLHPALIITVINDCSSKARSIADQLTRESHTLSMGGRGSRGRRKIRVVKIAKQGTSNFLIFFKFQFQIIL